MNFIRNQLVPPQRYCQLNVLLPKWDVLVERWHRLLRAYRFLPYLKRVGPQNSIINRLHEMAAEAKQVLRVSMESQKSLSMAG